MQLRRIGIDHRERLRWKRWSLRSDEAARLRGAIRLEVVELYLFSVLKVHVVGASPGANLQMHEYVLARVDCLQVLTHEKSVPGVGERRALHGTRVDCFGIIQARIVYLLRLEPFPLAIALATLNAAHRLIRQVLNRPC